jgi:MFS transporter, FHS family, glucose/mannose:H+ symporter
MIRSPKGNEMNDASALISKPTLSSGSTAILSLGFALTGVLTTLLGPLMPELSAKWNLNDAQAGALFTAQFAAATFGTLLTGQISARLGYIRSLAAAYALMAFGVTALGFAAWRIGVVSIMAYGFALGVAIPITNLLISDLNPTQRAAALNRLNVAWGLGAVSAPILIKSIGQTNLRGLLIAFAALLIVVAVWCFQIDSLTSGEGSTTTTAPRVKSSVWSSPLVPLYCALAFLYVGTENAIAGWIASYAQRIDLSQNALWALTPSVFWAALLLGRLAAPAILRRLSESRLILLGLGGAVVGVAILLMAHTLSGLFLGAAIAGLGLAPVFPTVIALFTQAFGASSSRVSGLFFALGGFGGATVPWIVGLLSTSFGGLRAGLVFPLVAALIMIALQRLLDRVPCPVDH